MREKRIQYSEYRFFLFIRFRTEFVSGTGPNGDRDCQRPIFMDWPSRSDPVDRSSVGFVEPYIYTHSPSSWSIEIKQAQLVRNGVVGGCA